MQLIGIVEDGVVVFGGQPALAEGTRVGVEPVEAGEPAEMTVPLVTLSERLLKLAGTVVGLPSDLAGNQDHDLHGQPKR